MVSGGQRREVSPSPPLKRRASLFTPSLDLAATHRPSSVTNSSWLFCRLPSSSSSSSTFPHFSYFPGSSTSPARFCPFFLIMLCLLNQETYERVWKYVLQSSNFHHQYLSSFPSYFIQPTKYHVLEAYKPATLHALNSTHHSAF